MQSRPSASRALVLPRRAPPQAPVPGSGCSAQATLAAAAVVQVVPKLRSASSCKLTQKQIYRRGLSGGQSRATGAGGERRQGLVRIAPSALLSVYPVAPDHHADRRKPCTGRGCCPRVCSRGCTRCCGTLRRTRIKCTACLLLTLRADGACARARAGVGERLPAAESHWTRESKACRDRSLHP